MWSRALAFAALSLLAAPSFAAVTLDAVTYAQCNGCSSLSYSHTIAAGSDLSLAVAGTVYELSSAYDDVSGVTHNGSAVAEHCWYSTSSGTVPHYDVGWYVRVNPTTGSQTVLVTATGAVSGIGSAAISASGVHQTTPLGTCANATGNSTTPSVVVSSATNDLVLDAGVIDHTGTLTVGSGQTQRWNSIDDNGFVKFFGSTEPGAASVTMNWSNSIGAPLWNTAGVSFKQVSGSVASPPRLMLLGVGP